MVKKLPDNKKTPNNKYLIYGRHSVISMLMNKRRKYENVICTKDTLDYLQKTLAANNISFDSSQFDIVDANFITTKISNRKNNVEYPHQGIAAYVHKLDQYDLYEVIEKSSTLVLLDQLQDSQNIGAIIRSAAAFNIDAVISTLHSSPDENAQMVKASCGAFEHIPFLQIINLSQTIEILKKKGYWIIGMDLQGDISLYDMNKSFSANEKIALVMGNEDKGMRKMTMQHCDFIFKIPIESAFCIESLNVSNATAIALYEIRRLGIIK